MRVARYGLYRGDVVDFMFPVLARHFLSFWFLFPHRVPAKRVNSFSGRVMEFAVNSGSNQES